MVHPEIRLSTREKVQLLWLVPLVLFRTVLSSVFGVLTDKSAARHPIRTVGVNFLRHVTLTLSFRQRLAGDVLSTGDAVAAFCAARKLAHSAVPVPVPAAGRGDRASTFHAPAIPDATLHLITVNSSPSNPTPSSSPASSNRTILYLHGGGFAHPINSQGQIPLAQRCAEALASSHPGSTTTLAILEYHLAPAHRYPTQLAQSLAALRTLVTGGAGLAPVPPEQIVLLGDSAGGNLLLGVLAALKAGRAPRGVGDEVVAWWRGDMRPLAAAVAVCPWCGLGEYAGRGAGSSYERNARWDFLYVKEMEEMEEAVGMGRARGVVWGDMVGAAKARKVEEEDGDEDGEWEGEEERGEWGAEFWSGVVRGEGRVVERMLVSVGTREVFLDDVVEFVGLMGAGREDGVGDGKVVFVKGPNEVHVGPVVDVALGINDEEGSLPAILSFFKGL